MGHLKDQLSQARRGQRRQVRLGFVLVIQLGENPAEQSNRRAQEPFSGEVITESGGANADVDDLPVSGRSAKQPLALSQEFVGGWVVASPPSGFPSGSGQPSRSQPMSRKISSMTF